MYEDDWIEVSNECISKLLCPEDELIDTEVYFGRSLMPDLHSCW